MPIYINGNKASGLYYGGAKIKEAYYGNVKVYSSGIPVWRFTYTQSGSTFDILLVGNYSTSGIPLVGNQSGTDTITRINGNLGESGSSVRISSAGSYDMTYRNTYLFNGEEVYEYAYNDSYGGVECLVLGGSVVGDVVLKGFWPNRQNTINSLNDTTIVVKIGTGSTITGTRDPSYLKYWTKGSLT